MSKLPKRRNLQACNPLLRKGGVHQKSNGALRAAAKRQWKMQSRNLNRDWNFSELSVLAA